MVYNNDIFTMEYMANPQINAVIPLLILEHIGTMTSQDEVIIAGDKTTLPTMKILHHSATGIYIPEPTIPFKLGYTFHTSADESLLDEQKLISNLMTLTDYQFNTAIRMDDSKMCAVQNEYFNRTDIDFGFACPPDNATKKRLRIKYDANLEHAFHTLVLALRLTGIRNIHQHERREIGNYQEWVMVLIADRKDGKLFTISTNAAKTTHQLIAAERYLFWFTTIISTLVTFKSENESIDIPLQTLKSCNKIITQATVIAFNKYKLSTQTKHYFQSSSQDHTLRDHTLSPSNIMETDNAIIALCIGTYVEILKNIHLSVVLSGINIDGKPIIATEDLDCTGMITRISFERLLKTYCISECNAGHNIKGKIPNTIFKIAQTSAKSLTNLYFAQVKSIQQIQIATIPRSSVEQISISSTILSYSILDNYSLNAITKDSVQTRTHRIYNEQFITNFSEFNTMMAAKIGTGQILDKVKEDTILGNTIMICTTKTEPVYSTDISKMEEIANEELQKMRPYS